RLLNISGTFSSAGGGPLHGPAEQWVRELVELALGDGVGTFILASDDPDDLRLSDRQVWDESARPTGPAPDPTRTYTAHEQATGQHLVQVHDGLRGELAQIHDLIEQVAAGEIDAGAARSQINTMTMRQNRWTL